MISRKLAIVRNGQVVHREHSHPFVPELKKIKDITFNGLKKLGYALIFITLRFFIKFSNFIKTKGILIIANLKNKLKKRNGNNLNTETEKKEVSKYLKIIGEYQQKIRKMKYKIKEEEGIE